MQTAPSGLRPKTKPSAAAERILRQCGALDDINPRLILIVLFSNRQVRERRIQTTAKTYGESQSQDPGPMNPSRTTVKLKKRRARQPPAFTGDRVKATTLARSVPSLYVSRGSYSGEPGRLNSTLAMDTMKTSRSDSQTTTPSFEPSFWDPRDRSHLNLEFRSLQASEAGAAGTAQHSPSDEQIQSKTLAARAAPSIDSILELANQLSSLECVNPVAISNGLT